MSLWPLSPPTTIAEATGGSSGDAVHAAPGSSSRSKRQRRHRAAASWQKVDPTYKPSYSVRVAAEREHMRRAPVEPSMDPAVRGSNSSSGMEARLGGCKSNAWAGTAADRRVRAVSPYLEAPEGPATGTGESTGDPAALDGRCSIGERRHVGSKNKATAEAHAGAADGVRAVGCVRGVNQRTGIGGGGRGAGEDGLCTGTAVAGRDVSKLGSRWGESLLRCTEQQGHVRVPPPAAEKGAEGGRRVQSNGSALQQWHDKEVQDKQVGRELTQATRPYGRECEACRAHGPMVSPDEAGRAQQEMQAFWSVKIADTAVGQQAGGQVSVHEPRFFCGSSFVAFMIESKEPYTRLQTQGIHQRFITPCSLCCHSVPKLPLELVSCLISDSACKEALPPYPCRSSLHNIVKSKPTCTVQQHWEAHPPTTPSDVTVSSHWQDDTRMLDGEGGDEEEDEEGGERSVLSLPDIASHKRVSSTLAARLLPSEVSRDTLHRACAVGQIDCKYIVALASGMLFLVDQVGERDR